MYIKMINTPNIEKAKKQIKSSKPPIIVNAQTLEFNRKILEYSKIQILLALTTPLNHIQAKIATKNNIAIGLDLQELRKLEKKQKAKRLETIKQNIKILRKAKTKIRLLNQKDFKNAQAFLITLGASSQQTKLF
jgi:RNase P/RNase MRP subunit p30